LATVTDEHGIFRSLSQGDSRNRTSQLLRLQNALSEAGAFWQPLQMNMVFSAACRKETAEIAQASCYGCKMP
jgi:hypothetical protein